MRWWVRDSIILLRLLTPVNKLWTNPIGYWDIAVCELGILRRMMKTPEPINTTLIKYKTGNRVQGICLSHFSGCDPNVLLCCNQLGN